MRACAACFWCPPSTRDPKTGMGECWNRPPMVFAVPQPEVDGRIEVSIISARAPVRLDEFCFFFQHHKEK